MTVAKSLFYVVLGTIYVMCSYYIIPPIVNSFVGSSSFASVVYIALIISWIVAVIAVPLYTLYKVIMSGNVTVAIITFIMGVLLLYFGYWMIPGFINAVTWEGNNGLIARGVLWTGWVMFVIGSVIFMPIYQIIANRKENRWIGND